MDYLKIHYVKMDDTVAKVESRRAWKRAKCTCSSNEMMKHNLERVMHKSRKRTYIMCRDNLPA